MSMAQISMELMDKFFLMEMTFFGLLVLRFLVTRNLEHGIGPKGSKEKINGSH